MRVRSSILLAGVLVGLTALPATAQAAPTKKCGAILPPDSVIVTNIRATGTTCVTGKAVARGWAGQNATGRSGNRVRVNRRTWACRITQTSNGSDPNEATILRTKIRCARGKSIVRFELRP